MIAELFTQLDGRLLKILEIAEYSLPMTSDEYLLSVSASTSACRLKLLGV
jgi:hypothetical protein